MALAFVFGTQTSTLDDKKAALALAKECPTELPISVPLWASPAASIASGGDPAARLRVSVRLLPASQPLFMPREVTSRNAISLPCWPNQIRRREMSVGRQRSVIWASVRAVRNRDGDAADGEGMGGGEEVDPAPRSDKANPEHATGGSNLSGGRCIIRQVHRTEGERHASGAGQNRVANRIRCASRDAMPPLVPRVTSQHDQTGGL